MKLSAAGAQIAANPAALELRRMQMISEVGAENNSTTVLNDHLARQRPAKSGNPPPPAAASAKARNPDATAASP